MSAFDPKRTWDEPSVDYGRDYFGGFTVEEVAKILNTSTATVEREWRFARSWLKREMT